MAASSLIVVRVLHYGLTHCAANSDGEAFARHCHGVFVSYSVWMRHFALVLFSARDLMDVVVAVPPLLYRDVVTLSHPRIENDTSSLNCDA